MRYVAKNVFLILVYCLENKSIKFHTIYSIYQTFILMLSIENVIYQSIFSKS